MTAFDVAAAQRWARFDPRHSLQRRADDDLPFVSEDRLAGQALFLDTCVYIDQMQGRAPTLLARLIASREVAHSTVAVQELMHTVGVLDPEDPRSSGVVTAIRHQIEAIRPHRLFLPDVETLGRAALLSGMICRLQNYTADHRLKALQDCTLFLQAQKLGFVVLTRNISDFDRMLQLMPAGRALFYRH